MSAVPHKDPRGRRRPTGYDRAAPLSPIDLETHRQILDARKIVSGRCRGYVYSWHHGRLHWHRYVVPKDPRTSKQRRSRAAFRKASKAWSEIQPLTQTQRDAWYSAAAKIESKPRLGTSGFLTAQQHFVGSNSLKDRWGLPLLLEPPTGGRKKAVHPPQSSYGGREGRRRNTRVPTQLPCFQPLTRPSSERPHTSSLPLPEQCRWQARSPHPVGSIGLPRWSYTLAHIPRNSRFRELWRGG